MRLIFVSGSNILGSFTDAILSGGSDDYISGVKVVVPGLRFCFVITQINGGDFHLYLPPNSKPGQAVL